MRIIYLLGFLPPYITREIEAVAGKGHSISVLLPGKSKNSAIADFWNGISNDPAGTSISISRSLKFEYLTCSKTKLLLPLLSSLRYFRSLIKALKEGEFRYFLIAAEAVSAMAPSERPRLIHAHFALDQAHIARIMASIISVPYTITTHATDIFVPKCRTRLVRVLTGASAVLTISNYNVSHLRGYGVKKDRITVARLALDTEELPARKKTTSPLYAVCTASGLVEKKGVPVLIRAMEILKEKNLKLIVIGSDPRGTKLEYYRKKCAHLDIEFPGALTSSATLEIVSNASFFVLPCIEAENKDKDGIPVALMEAMGMGVPCISTELSGIPELIENNVSGFLVRPGSAEELSGAITTMLSERELADSLGRAGQIKVITNHSPIKQAGILSDRFTEIVEERKYN